MEGGERGSAHRIDVGEGVRGGDATPVAWIVDDGCEEVDRLDERQVIRDPVDPGVIRPVDPDEQIRVPCDLRSVQTAQNLRQLVRSEFARSAGAVAV